MSVKLSYDINAVNCVVVLLIVKHERNNRECEFNVSKFLLRGITKY